MKITLFLMLVLVAGVNARGLAQRVNLSLKDAPLEQALSEIRKQADYRFLYNDELIRNAMPVNVDIKNANVEEALRLLMHGQRLKFKIIAGTVSITSAEQDMPATQQLKDFTITGTVKDTAGIPLPGASVTVKNAAGKGVMTDNEGRFKLTVPPDAVLIISFVGFQQQEVKVGVSTTISVILHENKSQLNEVVVVGYGTQKRSTLTGSVATVKGEQLQIGPVANISNSLGGNISGIITRQTSGEPGADASSVLVRGTAPLVLVDGIQRAWDKINMQDVESVSVLKDASAVAPYGLRGANGVILITTKRGKAGSLSLNYSVEYGIQKPTNTPDFMDAYEGLKLRNEALLTDGRPNEVITDEILEQYRIGTDAYPNTDWVENYLGSSSTQNHNVTLTGGSELARAFVSLGYYKQGSMFGRSNGYDRYNIRSNLDMKPTKTTELSLDLSLSNDEKKSHNLSAPDIMLNVYRARAAEADIYSNGLPAYQTSLGASLNQLVYGGGDRSDKNNFQNIGITLKQDVPFIKGLSLKGFFNYDRQAYDYKNWSEPVISYKYNQNSGEYEVDNAWLRSKPSLAQGNRIWTYYTTQGFLNYSNQFGNHGVSALAVYERRWGNRTEYSASRSQYDFTIPELNMGSPNKEFQGNNGTSNKTAQDGFVFRANYNYKQKYLLEFAGRYDRSFLYAPDKRSAIFPSASLGWRVSEESFFKERFSFVNNLKLRASYGKSGNPVGEEFAFLSKYLINNSYVWGTTPLQEQGVYEGKEPNILLTWETVWKANIGLDLTMWNGLLGLELDVYRDYRSDKILAPDAIVPIEYGIGLSDENAGKEERYGIDFTLSNNTKLSSNWNMQHSAVFGFTRNKQIEIREAAGTYNIPQLRRTGLPSSQLRGYKSAGLFKDQADIDNWAYQNASILPGDIKYVDINGDGKVNSEDQVVIGKTRTPEIMYGYNLGIKYKSFDLGMLIQGTANSDYYLGYGADGSSGDRGVRYPFENDKPLADHINSWSVNNQDPNAAYPRLSTTKRTHNFEVSDFWVVNSSYVKLKSLSLGYTFSNALTKKAFMNQVRAYANCYNLWTIFSNMPDDFDSENQAYNAYPQQFIVSMGLNITF